MDVDEPEEEEDDDDEPEDSEEVKALKARRRYLRSLQFPTAVRRPQPMSRPPRRNAIPKRPALQTLPGYTVLVCDTNILLSSLSLVSSLISTLRWTVIVPLAVVTELDGLSNNPTELGATAVAAMSYLMSAVQTHSISFKIQTSQGNYSTCRICRFDPKTCLWGSAIGIWTI